MKSFKTRVKLSQIWRLFKLKVEKNIWHLDQCLKGNVFKIPLMLSYDQDVGEFLCGYLCKTRLVLC